MTGLIGDGCADGAEKVGFVLAFEFLAAQNLGEGYSYPVNGHNQPALQIANYRLAVDAAAVGKSVAGKPAHASNNKHSLIPDLPVSEH